MDSRTLRRWVPSLVLFGTLLVLWQVLPPLFRVREYLLPGPVAVVRAALNFSIPWHTHVWITTLEILGGFALAGAAGVVLGVALAWSQTVARALMPFLVVVNTLPKVAVAPLFLLYDYSFRPDDIPPEGSHAALAGCMRSLVARTLASLGMTVEGRLAHSG